MYAVITGASSGIGAEIAHILADRKYDLILTARREDRLLSMQESIKNMYHVDVQIYPTDLSITKNCYELFDFTKSFPVGIVINAAGFGKVGLYDAVSMDDEIEMIQTNIIALQVLTKLYAKHMKKGRILNIASIAAFQPGPAFATYSASKAYVFNYSMAVNYELRKKKKNVSISVLCPGPVETEFDQVAGTNFSLSSISAEYCAKVAVDGLLRGKPIIVPGKKTSILRLASRITPYKLILPIEYEIQTRKLRKPASK